MRSSLTSWPEETQGPKEDHLIVIAIDAMTEAFANVVMHQRREPAFNARWILVQEEVWCPFEPWELFPNQLTKAGLPTGLQKCNTKLRAYNGTNIPQFGALDTTISWKDEETKKVCKMDTTFYVTDTPG